MDSCRADFEYSAASGDLNLAALSKSDAGRASGSAAPSSNSADGDGGGGTRRPSAHLLSGLHGGQEVRSVSASLTEGSFARWLELYAAGKWDPSRPSPFGQPSPWSSASTSTATRSERSVSSSSAATEGDLAGAGPELRRFQADGWLPPPRPPNEDARRRALYRHAVLPDANPSGAFDPSFQRISKMAQRALGVAACVILLVEKEHLPVLASVGFSETIYERESSICGHSILRSEPHVILDTNKDWRLNTTHPYVQGDTPIRFYAGTQLKTRDGFSLGTLCCIDTKPHASFDEDEREMLLAYGELAMKEIELRMTKSHLSRIDKTSQALQMLTREVAEMGNLSAASDLPQVYESAAHAIRRTLDIEGCAILDLSAFRHVKPRGTTGLAPRSADYRFLPNDAVFSPSVSQPNQNNALAVLSMSERDPPMAIHPEHNGFFEPALDGDRVAQFLSAHPEGKLFDATDKPLWTGYPCPTNVTYVYIAPILTPDLSPVALVVAYTCSPAQEFLEPECQFLQAVSGVVLSALLIRRVQEGDKVKAQFISNMSHELRTPVHGILASSELLGDTDLTPAQSANLRAIQTCSTSLASTIEHVLAFTKTTAQSLSGRRESLNSIDATNIDLLKFVEETVASTFVAYQFGVRSRSDHSDLGSLHDPNAADEDSALSRNGTVTPGGPPQLQCLLDLQDRPGGWDVQVDAVGLGRCLVNLVGNALKYTSQGFVRVSLSSPPPAPGDDRVPVQISIIDTGRGMSEDFLAKSCFQPFAQEDTISPGTGLGLAITSNLIRSLGGRIAVSSVQGRGSEFTVTLSLPSPKLPSPPRPTPSFAGNLSVAYVGFPKANKTLQLQRKLLNRHFEAWGVSTRSGAPRDGDLLIVDESAPAGTLLQYPNHRALFLVGSRQLSPVDPLVHVLLKPVGPLQLEKVVHEVLSAQRPGPVEGDRLRAAFTAEPHTRPPPAELSSVAATSWPLAATPIPSSPYRILLVEDNSVNRSVLRMFFKKKGVPLDEAVDGAKGAAMFERAPPGHYSIVLMDLSMPVLSGFQSTELIRAYEAAQQAIDPAFPRTPIFALTGSSSSEVEQRALSNGFDHFISKPVALKDLWTLLKDRNLV